MTYQARADALYEEWEYNPRKLREAIAEALVQAREEGRREGQKTGRETRKRLRDALEELREKNYAAEISKCERSE